MRVASVEVDAGLYEMKINAPDGLKSYSDLLNFKPPEEVREIDLTP